MNDYVCKFQYEGRYLRGYSANCKEYSSAKRRHLYNKVVELMDVLLNSRNS